MKTINTYKLAFKQTYKWKRNADQIIYEKYLLLLFFKFDNQKVEQSVPNYIFTNAR